MSAKEAIPQRILIVRLSAIGDCVMASPVAQKLREAFPQAHIAWAVGEKSKAIVEGNPYIDEILVWRSGRGGFTQIVRDVRAGRFDVVLELQGRPKSTILMALSGARRRLVSPRFGWLARVLSTQLVEHPPGFIYPPLRYVCWAKALGASGEDPKLSVPIAKADREAAREVLVDTQATWIGLNPGCSAPNRKWDVEKFAAAAEQLAGTHPEVHFVICGGKQDVDDANIIAAKLPAERTVNAAGKLNLRATAALLERCSAVITNDTGPMHMAVAVGAPVVGIFGPVEANRRLPDNGLHVGIEHNEECRLPNTPKCGRGGQCSCLQSVRPDEVAAAVTTVLVRTAAK
jgi:lipopolysaccharide heptosyltransferase II